MLSLYQRTTSRGIDLQKEEKRKAANKLLDSSKKEEEHELLSTIPQSSVTSNETKNIYGGPFNVDNQNTSSLKKDANKENIPPLANVVPKFKLTSQVRYPESTLRKRSNTVNIIQNQQICPPRRNSISEGFPTPQYIITSGVPEITFAPICSSSDGLSGTSANCARNPLKIKYNPKLNLCQFEVNKMDSVDGISNFVVTMEKTYADEPASNITLKRKAEDDRPFMLYNDDKKIYNSNLNRRKVEYLKKRSPIVSAASVGKVKPLSPLKLNDGDSQANMDTSTVIEETQPTVDKSSKKEKLSLPQYSSMELEQASMLTGNESEEIVKLICESASEIEELQKSVLPSDESDVQVEEFNVQTSLIKILPTYSAMLAEKSLISDEDTSMLAEVKKEEQIFNIETFNDVVAMAGLNIEKEYNFAMEFGIENIGTEIRPCTETPFLNFANLIARYSSQCHDKVVEENALKMLSYGVVDYTKSVIEKVVEQSMSKGACDVGFQQKYLDMPNFGYDRKEKTKLTRKGPVKRITLNDMLSVIENQKESFQKSIFLKAMNLRKDEESDF